jgi:predicted hotdog family 3-hydroxylacyl-ACP dehydratase
LIQGARLAVMLPHAGAMVLLDAVVEWDATRILCRSRSHLDVANPLLRNGRLSAVCGVEYGLQAAALHGALLAGGVAQRAGYVARLRDVVLAVDRLDDAALGTLAVEAVLERAEAGGMLYALAVSDVRGRVVVAARAGVSLPATPAGLP